MCRWVLSGGARGRLPMVEAATFDRTYQKLPPA